MSSSSDHRHAPRSLRLPSGRTVDVVCFSSAPGAPVPAELHVCPACAGELVYPTGWHRSGPERWEVARRCPSCEWRGTGHFDRALVDRFDERLDQGAEAVLTDLRRMARANMEDEALRFTRDLFAGRIGAEDFRAA